MIRNPIAAIWSMSERRWGSSQTTVEPRYYSIAENTENWCACADLVVQYAADPGTYICQFGRLVSEPREESERIFEFLGIRGGRTFEPRPTKRIGFSDSERALILQNARQQIDALSALGFSDLA
jgi:hypothetical protein